MAVKKGISEWYVEVDEEAMEVLTPNAYPSMDELMQEAVDFGNISEKGFVCVYKLVKVGDYKAKITAQKI